MEHHRDHLDKKYDSKYIFFFKRSCTLWKPAVLFVNETCRCARLIHLHLSSLPWSSGFSSLCRSLLHTVLTAVDQNLHHIQRLRLRTRLHGEMHISHRRMRMESRAPGTPTYLHVSLLGEVNDDAPAEVGVVVFHLRDQHEGP